MPRESPAVVKLFEFAPGKNPLCRLPECGQRVADGLLAHHLARRHGLTTTGRPPSDATLMGPEGGGDAPWDAIVAFPLEVTVPRRDVVAVRARLAHAAWVSAQRGEVVAYQFGRPRAVALNAPVASEWACLLEHQRLLLRAVATRDGDGSWVMFHTDARGAYQALCRREGVAPRGYTAFWSLMHELESEGWLQVEPAAGRKGGRALKVRLAKPLPLADAQPARAVEASS